MFSAFRTLLYPRTNCFKSRSDKFYCGFTVSSFYHFFCIFSVRFSRILTIILSPVSAECLPWRPAFLLFILFVHAILLFIVCLEINRSCVELNTCRGRRSTMVSLHLFVQHDAQLSASRGSVCGNWYLIGSVRYYTVSKQIDKFPAYCVLYRQLLVASKSTMFVPYRIAKNCNICSSV